MHLSFDLHFEQHYWVTAERMQVQRGRKWPSVIARMIGVLLLSLIALLPWIGRPNEVPFGEAVFTSAVWGILTVMLIPELRALLRTLYERRTLGVEARYTTELGEEGIAVTSARGSVLFRWEVVDATQLMTHTLFFRVQNNWHAIPADAFRSLEDLRDAAEFIDSRQGWAGTTDGASTKKPPVVHGPSNPYAAPRVPDQASESSRLALRAEPTFWLASCRTGIALGQ